MVSIFGRAQSHPPSMPSLYGFYAEPVLGPPNGRPCEPGAFGGGLNLLLWDRSGGQYLFQKLSQLRSLLMRHRSPLRRPPEVQRQLLCRSATIPIRQQMPRCLSPGSPTIRCSSRKAKPLPRGARLFLTGSNSRRLASSGSRVTMKAARAAATNAIEPIKRLMAVVPVAFGG